MARTVRDAKIDSRSARAKLPVQKSVFWVTISRGFAMGYRKGAKGGVWLVKLVRDGDRAEQTLGSADDALDPDGKNILDYSQAQDEARKWLKTYELKKDGEPVTHNYSVENALDDYFADYKRRSNKATKDLQSRINGQIKPALGKLLLSKLTKKRLRDWHAGVADAGARLRTSKKTEKKAEQKFREFDTTDDEQVRKRRASANRLLTILKAALNFAVAEGKFETDEAWRHVKPFKDVDIPKIRYLTLKQCETLIDNTQAGFRPLVQAALLTGCRYGELIALNVEEYDDLNKTLFIRRSKSGKSRHVILTDEGAAFFRATVGDRPGDERMFKREDGHAWGKSHQHRPMKDACKEAKIKPAVSFHVLRHTYASHLVMGGASLQVVAANLGHADTRVTERHYAHLDPTHVTNVIRAKMPKMNIRAGNLKVVAG
ncbi:MAG: site-specific integrase [Proteobacteria bacterium]|nr:site-specific integrase [Pseudomonadota bacterium]MCC6912172.1 site-specific integrase [Rhodospirillaceae bacterium]